MYKTLANGDKVPARMYYYLIDWRDENMQRFHELTQRHTVNTLTKQEFNFAFKEATKQDSLEMEIVCQP